MRRKKIREIKMKAQHTEDLHYTLWKQSNTWQFPQTSRTTDSCVETRCEIRERQTEHVLTLQQTALSLGLRSLQVCTWAVFLLAIFFLCFLFPPVLIFPRHPTHHRGQCRPMISTPCFPDMTRRSGWVWCDAWVFRTWCWGTEQTCHGASPSAWHSEGSESPWGTFPCQSQHTERGKKGEGGREKRDKKATRNKKKRNRKSKTAWEKIWYVKIQASAHHAVDFTTSNK